MAANMGRIRPRGMRTAAAAAVTAGLLLFPGVVPNVPGRLGSLVETFLPWLGLLAPVLLGLGLLRRNPLGVVAALVLVAVWLAVFGRPLLVRPEAAYDLTVVQHNIDDRNPDPAGTARALLDARADLVALEELTPSALPAVSAALAAEYPHHANAGTVGLWSKHPLSETGPVDIRPSGVGTRWLRSLRATVSTPRGPVAVYVAHLPSVRIGFSGFRSTRRDESAALLAHALAAEPVDRIILLGDLNGTVDDRGLAPVTSRLSGPRTGLAFSWPAALPVARIDHALARGAFLTHVWTLPETGSDHLPVAARVRL
ncbi:endonuclease [Streptomyces sp. CB03234]|nr:endonuclease [Streptomyces sp. CB03234]